MAHFTAPSASLTTVRGPLLWRIFRALCLALLIPPPTRLSPILEERPSVSASFSPPTITTAMARFHVIYIHCPLRQTIRRTWRALTCALSPLEETYEFQGATVTEGSRRTRVYMDMRPPIPECAMDPGALLSTRGSISSTQHNPRHPATTTTTTTMTSWFASVDDTSSHALSAGLSVAPCKGLRFPKALIALM